MENRGRRSLESRFETTEPPVLRRKMRFWTERPSAACSRPRFWAPNAPRRSGRSPATALSPRNIGHPSPIGQEQAPKPDRLLVCCPRNSWGLDLAILVSSRSRSVLAVHVVRLCSVRSLGLTRMAISSAQDDIGVAGIRLRRTPCSPPAMRSGHDSERIEQVPVTFASS